VSYWQSEGLKGVKSKYFKDKNRFGFVFKIWQIPFLI